MEPSRSHEPPPTVPSGPPETSVEVLWQRWRQEQCPDFPDASTDPPSAEAALAVLRFDQCHRWRQGERVPTERYLERYSLLRSGTEEALLLIYGEYLLRQEIGEAPDLDEFLQRFPDYAERLREQDAFHRAVVAESWPPAPPGQAGACRIVGEIARGGMGVVLKGHDEQLDRDLAVKVLRDEYRDQPDIVRRFLAEAQVCGQLQHPGVVPVHELGRFADGRPYFTMKLVEGRTLAELLAERKAASQDLPRLLKVFEQVCQTVAYAHSRGVLHRDLKPGNVMVGAFGEVQLMDWGLARRLSEPRPSGSGDAEPLPDGRGSDGAHTHAGAVLGTPAYMAPEQARGEDVDARADVFGLGAVLCEILSGQPPYAGQQAYEVLRRAQKADLADARARLDRCGADAELLGLTRECLAAEPADRPCDAGAVAQRMMAYLAGVQERLKAAEVERAAAQARAEQAAAKAAAERRARWLTAGLAATVLALAAAAGGGWLWMKGQRDARAAAFRTGKEQATRLLEAGLWPPARVAVQALPEPDDPDERQWLREFLADLDMLERLTEIRASVPGRLDLADIDAEYAQAFRDYGVDLDALPTEEAVRRIRARPDVVATELVGMAYDWSRHRIARDPRGAGRQRLAAVTLAADPDPWRRRLREIATRDGFGALRQMARDPRLGEQSPQSLVMLGGLLTHVDVPAGVSVLRVAQRRYPKDVWLNFHLAQQLEKLKPPQTEEAIGFYRVAASLRPEMTNQLAKALALSGRVDESIAIYRQHIPTNPHLPLLHNNLGLALHMKGDHQGAHAALDEALRLRPTYAEAHNSRAVVLTTQDRDEAALAAVGQALQHKAKFPRAHHNRGHILFRLARLPDALAAYDQAVAEQPDFAEAHCGRGDVLSKLSRFADAATAFRQAARFKPDHAEAHCGFGLALQELGLLPEALKALKRGDELGARTPAWRLPSKQWVRISERLLEADPLLPALLRRDAEPESAEQAAWCARLCRIRGWPETAAASYERAFADDPKLADDVQAGHRHDAARAAALAGCGKGKEKPPPDEPTRVRRRRQALDWLRADLALRGRLADGTASERAAVRDVLLGWRHDTDLAGLRDQVELAKRPAEERDAWTKFWADVDGLLARTRRPK